MINGLEGIPKIKWNYFITQKFCLISMLIKVISRLKLFCTSVQSCAVHRSQGARATHVFSDQRTDEEQTSVEWKIARPFTAWVNPEGVMLRRQTSPKRTDPV